MPRKPNTQCYREACAKPIYRRPFQIETGNPRYCSKNCLNEDRAKNKNLLMCHLETCTVEFSRVTSGQRFCSRSCSNTARKGIRYDGSNAKNKYASAVRNYVLLVEAYGEFCSACKIPNEWNGQQLRLQVDHINGENSDNRFENLRLLCPNCHSQTPTFGARNIKFKTKIAARKAGNQREAVTDLRNVNFVDTLAGDN